MSASEELYALLMGSPSTSVGDRVYIDAAPQVNSDPEGDPYAGLFPFIVFRRARIERDYGLDNTLLAKHETFHIECWAEYREQAQAIEEEVVDRLISIGIPPQENDPDAITPTQDVRCCVVVAKFIS